MEATFKVDKNTIRRPKKMKKTHAMDLMKNEPSSLRDWREGLTNIKVS